MRCRIVTAAFKDRVGISAQSDSTNVQARTIFGFSNLEEKVERGDAGHYKPNSNQIMLNLTNYDLRVYPGGHPENSSDRGNRKCSTLGTKVLETFATTMAMAMAMAAQLKYNGPTNLTSFYYNCCGRVS